jgi:hydroxymethylbilane synthase
MPGPLRLGTRGSQLALAQAGTCAGILRQKNPGLEVAIVVLKTTGDQKTDIPLSSAGGLGLFTKELEDALLRHEIDAAVHSLKDLPTQTLPGLKLAAVSVREDWRDAWLSPFAFGSLEKGALVGTGSPRRRAQLALLKPGLRFTEFRGNVDTRLKKLAEGQVQGAVLAAAGLSRIGRLAEAKSLFSEDEMLPAPGQGFLGLECRAQDAEAALALQALDDAQARACADAERAFLDRLGAGCHAPVAALARAEGAKISLKGFTMNLDGRSFKSAAEGVSQDAEGLGRRLAEGMLSQGAEMTR